MATQANEFNVIHAHIDWLHLPLLSRLGVPFIDDGITGFVVDEEEQAVEAIKRLSEPDRHQVRERFEERFTAKRMAQEYTLYYQDLLARSVPRNPTRLTEFI